MKPLSRINLDRKVSLFPLVAICIATFAVFPAAQGQEKKSVSPASQNPAAQKTKAHRDGRIWGALVFATLEKVKAPKNIEKTLIQLGKAFPGKNFQLLGEHTQEIFSEYESWVVPSKDVFLKIDSKGPTEKSDGVNLHLQLWQKKNVLLKTDVILRKEPIFITGPRWGKGQLIMVVELR